MVKNKLDIIGSTAYVTINGQANIPAKIDTGADSSSIWASDIDISPDGFLTFKLFSPKSPFYTGEVLRRKQYSAVVVRSATGEEQIRYRTHLSLEINGRKIKALFNLSNRGKNNSPILIGKRTLRGKFIVDVSRAPIKFGKKVRSRSISAKLKKNPHEFHQKYIKNKGDL